MPIIPLKLLVYTTKGNIPFVSSALQKTGLLLDHPSSIFNLAHIPNFLYINPHDPPPGGHTSTLIGRPNHSSSGASRWGTPSIAGKSVEVQRTQAEEVFKSLRSGEELEETEPSTNPILPYFIYSCHIIIVQALISQLASILIRRKHLLSF